MRIPATWLGAGWGKLAPSGISSAKGGATIGRCSSGSLTATAALTARAARLLSATAVTAAVLVLAASASAAQPASLAAPAGAVFRSYRFEVSGRSVQIPSMLVRDDADSKAHEFISLGGAAAALGGLVTPFGPAGSYRLDLAGERAVFSVDYPSIVMWGSRIVSLSRDARPVGSDLYLPLDFLTRVVEPILHAHAGDRSAPGSAIGGPTPESRGLPTIRTSSSLKVPSLFPTVEAAVMPAAAAESASPRAVVPAGGDRVFTIVLDPGHGGEEIGAAGKTEATEKELTLQIAKKLQALLEKEPRTRVLLTRTDDSTVPLDSRTALANHNHADLFLSIHLNSAQQRDARGAETYFLTPQAKDDETRTIAAIENNAIGVDRASLGAAPVDLELVLWDLAQTQYIAESSRLAGEIQRELNEALGVKDRGVKEAPFRVLMGATMPAVLVEVGFLSNPAEEKLLESDERQDTIAQALRRAVVAFRSGAGPGSPAPAGTR
jgi:N-acetylmuramoyl-L-alanine amidase